MDKLLKCRNPRKNLNGPVSTFYYLKAYEIESTEGLNIPMVLPKPP